MSARNLKVRHRIQQVIVQAKAAQISVSLQLSPTPGRLCGSQVGQRVSAAGGKEGTVRYIGHTQFAGGEWIGVELDAPSGKAGAVGGRTAVCARPRPLSSELYDRGSASQASALAFCAFIS